MSVFRAPLIKMIEWAGVPVLPPGNRLAGRQLRSDGRAAVERLFVFLSWGRLGHHGRGAVRRLRRVAVGELVSESGARSLRILREKRLEDDAMRAYGGRWLGLWSTSDEAINGLRDGRTWSIVVNQITPRGNGAPCRTIGTHRSPICG